MRYAIQKLDFKKNYNDRTTSEKIFCDCLIQLQTNNNIRYVGALEATLISEGILKLGEPFEYKTYKGFLGIKFKETYKELIIRLTKEYLIGKNIL